MTASNVVASYSPGTVAQQFAKPTQLRTWPFFDWWNLWQAKHIGLSLEDWGRDACLPIQCGIDAVVHAPDGRSLLESTAGAGWDAAQHAQLSFRCQRWQRELWLIFISWPIVSQQFLFFFNLLAFCQNTIQLSWNPAPIWGDWIEQLVCCGLFLSRHAHLNKDDCSLALEVSAETQTPGIAWPTPAAGGFCTDKDTIVTENLFVDNTVIEPLSLTRHTIPCY